MFDIMVGTLIPAISAETMIPQLNQKGYECYELDFKRFEDPFHNMDEYAKKIKDVLEDRKISSIALYGNTMCDEEIYNKIEILIKNASKLDCDRVCMFAGGDGEKSVPDNIPLFKKKFGALAELAEAYNVKLGLENCGSGWDKGSSNIAFCTEAWELIFDAVPSDFLGLEWEPAHQLRALADPIPQLRRWAKKVVHVHGKDATVAWDVIKEYGVHGSKKYIWDRMPGFGDSNWSDIFTILLQAGFEGAVDIEGYHDPVHYDDMEWTAQLVALDYLKRCRGGIEYFEGPTEYRGYKGRRKK